MSQAALRPATMADRGGPPRACGGRSIARGRKANGSHECDVDLGAMASAAHMPSEFPLRHTLDDWCRLESFPPTRLSRRGSQLFAADRTARDAKVWVIVEWDRSVTGLTSKYRKASRLACPLL